MLEEGETGRLAFGEWFRTDRGTEMTKAILFIHYTVGTELGPLDESKDDGFFLSDQTRTDTVQRQKVGRLDTIICW